MTARVLIIEDNPINRELIDYLLRAYGFETLKALDGAVGLDMARRERPDLILCDIQMPVMDGIEFAHHVKSDPVLRQTPLIALAMLIAYLLVSGEVFLATSVHGVFRMSFSGVGPTELRILLAIGALALFRDPHVDLGGLGRLRLFDFGGVIAIAGMVVALTVNVVRNATALARLEPRISNRDAREDRRSVRFQADLPT